MTRGTTKFGQRQIRERTENAISALGTGSYVKIRLGTDDGAEISGELKVFATPARVFALLTDARQMMTWLAQRVTADPRPGGIFRLVDLNGLWVEGTYLEVILDQKVVFTWGGIEGLRPGQSTVQFRLRAEGAGTLLRLRHFDLSDAAIEAHYLGWKMSGLPKLKAVAEGEVPHGTCLGDAAGSREHRPYSTGVVW
jgi:uncharacterized protein YndB with AHSA1/START domain